MGQIARRRMNARPLCVPGRRTAPEPAVSAQWHGLGLHCDPLQDARTIDSINRAEAAWSHTHDTAIKKRSAIKNR